MLRCGVRRSAGLCAGLCAALVLISRSAAADDPRDAFGLARPTAAPAGDCGDGTTFGCAVATDPLADAVPHALRSYLPARYLLRLPVGNATHDAVSHYALGAGHDDAGPVFAGATGLENRWTIDGAPADNLRTGGADTRLPLTFLDGILVRAGGFAARDRVSTGGAIDAQLRRGTPTHALEAHAWFGLTSTAPARPIADNTYQVRRLATQAGPETTLSLVATGPLPALAGGRTWYAAGLAPTLATTRRRWSANRIVDRDGDGRPDGVPGQVVLENLGDTRETTLDYELPVLARAGWDRGPHQLALSVVGQVARSSLFQANATERAAGVDRADVVGDAIATWRGSWPNTRLRAQLAWHRSQRRETAHDDAGARVQQLQTAYIPTELVDDPRLASGCSDAAADDPYPTIPNCPVVIGLFRSAGGGLLVDSTGDRPSATVDASHRIGNHVLRAGATLEDSRLVLTSRHTGGAIVRSLFDGHTDTLRFYAGDCPEDPALPCAYADEDALTYRTRYTAAYLEDTATLGAIQVNGGVRWELMWVGPRLHLSRQLAPRLGATWDVLGGGTSRVWTSLGRSFVMLTPGLGSTVIGRNHSVRDIASDFGTARVVDGGSAYAVAADLEPAAQDEATLGVEVGRLRSARATAWVQTRVLRRGYETVLANSVTLEAQLANPGANGRSAPATRNTTLVAVELSSDPSAANVLRATYLYGHTVGTWTGPYDPRQGAQLFAGSEWDAESANLHGALPTDLGHRLAVEGERRGRLGAVELAVATRVSVTSGRPRNALGEGVFGTLQILPRGAYGRTLPVTQVNLRLAARWRGFDLALDLVNVFDRDAATSLDESYAGSGGSIAPIVGGSREDLVFLKDLAGGPALRDARFGLPAVFQTPIAGTLGLRRAF